LKKERKLLHKNYALSSLFLIILFLLPMGSPSVSKRTEIKDTLLLQIEEDITHIDNRYRLWRSTFDSMVGYNWQGYLLRLSPDSTVATFPEVVESYTIGGNGSNPIWSFTLREGLTFHDGTAITAGDVYYSFVVGRALFQGLSVMEDPPYHNLTEAEERSQELFNMTLPDGADGLKVQIGPTDPADSWFPDPSFPFAVLAGRNDFFLVPEGSHGSYDDDQETCSEKILEYQKAPISCGPYKFVEHKPQDYVLLERFDDWFSWGETVTDDFGNEWTFPTVDKAFKYVKWRVIPEPAMATVELETGGIDATTSKFESLDALNEIGDKPGFEVFMQDSLTYNSIELNAEGNWPTIYGGPGNYPLQKLWFRKAMVHAINRTNIVENAYSGIGNIREEFYPKWIMENFPGIDTSDYYIMNTDPAKAIQLLEDNGYKKLGFSEDPDNRFGYGPYLNETAIDGVNQTRGHVFVMIADDNRGRDPWKVQQAIAVQKDLADVGIITELRQPTMEWPNRIDPGWRYNTSYIALNQPDPEFKGPEWDFVCAPSSYWYEQPIQFVIYSSYVYWYFFGGGNAIYSEAFEVELAKMLGGRGYFDYVPYPLPGEFPVPQWTSDDVQYVEAAEEAGRIFTTEMLSNIPFAWQADTYAHNIHLKNFLPNRRGNRGGNILLAYSYWSTEATNTPTTFTTTTTTSDTTSVFNQLAEVVSFLQQASVLTSICLVLGYLIYSQHRRIQQRKAKSKLLDALTEMEDRFMMLHLTILGLKEKKQQDEIIPEPIIFQITSEITYLSNQLQFLKMEGYPIQFSPRITEIEERLFYWLGEIRILFGLHIKS
jgi:ABC-type transport system substrate-binding protein